MGALGRFSRAAGKEDVCYHVPVCYKYNKSRDREGRDWLQCDGAPSCVSLFFCNPIIVCVKPVKEQRQKKGPSIC